LASGQGAENTFPRDVSSFGEMKAERVPLVDKSGAIAKVRACGGEL